MRFLQSGLLATVFLVVSAQIVFAEESDVGLNIRLVYHIDATIVETMEVAEQVEADLREAGFRDISIDGAYPDNPEEYSPENQIPPYTVQIRGIEDRSNADSVLDKLAELGYSESELRIGMRFSSYAGLRTGSSGEPIGNEVMYRVNVLHTTPERNIETASVSDRLDELGYETGRPKADGLMFHIPIGRFSEYADAAKLKDKAQADGFVVVITRGHSRNDGFRFTEAQVCALRAMAAEYAQSMAELMPNRSPEERWEFHFRGLAYMELQSRINESANLVLAGEFETEDEALNCIEHMKQYDLEGLLFYHRDIRPSSRDVGYCVLVDCVFESGLADKYVEDLKDKGYGKAKTFYIGLSPGIHEIEDYLPGSIYPDID